MIYCSICGGYTDCRYRANKGIFSCDSCDSKAKKQASCKLATSSASPSSSSSRAPYICPICQDSFRRDEFKQIIEAGKEIPFFECVNGCLLSSSMFSSLQEDYDDLDLTLFKLRKPAKTQDQIKKQIAKERRKAQAWVQPLLFGLEWYKCWQCGKRRNVYSLGQFRKVESRNEKIPFFYRCPCGHLTASTKMERVENV